MFHVFTESKHDGHKSYHVDIWGDKVPYTLDEAESEVNRLNRPYQRGNGYFGPPSNFVANFETA